MFNTKINSSTLLKSALFILNLVFLLALNYLGIDLDLLLMILIISAGVYLIYNYPNFIIRYIAVFFMAIGNLAGVFICEHSHIWLSELDCYSRRVGSLPLIILGWELFISVLWLLDYRIPFQVSKPIFIAKVKLGKKFVNFQKVSIYILLFMAFILTMNTLRHPFWIEHIDRFLYRDLYITGLWKRIDGWISLGIPLLLLPVLMYKKTKRNFDSAIIPLFTLLLYVLYLFCTGEKFGGFWSIIVNVCIVYSCLEGLAGKAELRRKILKLGKIFLFIVLVVSLHMYLNYQLTPRQFIENYLPQRIAQQGQLWWKTYDLDRNNGMRIDELNDETRTYFQTDEGQMKKYNHAIYKIMRFTTPEDIFNKKINSGSRYSTSTFASMFYYFKEAGVILWAIIGGCFFGLLMRMFLYAVSHMYVLEIIIVSRLLEETYHVLAMSEFNLLFQVKPVVFFLIFLLMIYLRNFIYESNLKNET